MQEEEEVETRRQEDKKSACGNEGRTWLPVNQKRPFTRVKENSHIAPQIITGCYPERHQTTQTKKTMVCLRLHWMVVLCVSVSLLSRSLPLSLFGSFCCSRSAFVSFCLWAIRLDPRLIGGFGFGLLVLSLVDTRTAI